VIAGGLKAGDAVVVGMRGIRVLPEAKERDRNTFAFMSNEISSERQVETAVRQTANLIQKAMEQGLKVIAVAGSDDHAKLGLELGADHAVNYNTHDLTAEVMKLTSGKGVNVLYDNIANPKVLPKAFLALGFGGRLVTAGAHGGPNVTIDFSHLYHKQITIRGRPGYHPLDVPKCFAAAAAGKIKTRIERVLPLSQAALAHQLVEGRESVGKIVLDPTLSSGDVP